MGALLHRSGAGWAFGLCVAAGEGGGTFRYQREWRGGGGVRGEAVDAERSVVEAGRRARTKVRRYCAANGLNRLGTLTYAGAGVHDPFVVRRDLGVFFRNLRSALGGDPLPYVWVPELHPGGHGFHAHFAVGQYVRRSLISAAWGLGFVHIKLLGDLGVGSTAKEEARRAAGYLSKYVAKTFEQPTRTFGGHRYDVAEGFQPAVEAVRGPTVEAVRAVASERMGAVPVREWSSSADPAWAGPPAVWFQWA